MDDATDYIINAKGQEVISERHNPEFKRENGHDDDFGNRIEEDEYKPNSAFTNVSFEEI
jgi:hypothetical protein